MENFINIPDFLINNDEIQSNSSISPLAGCMSFCEVYNECCGYEDCQHPNESGCTSGCESTCQSSEAPPAPVLPTPSLNTSLTVKTANSIKITINTVYGATTYTARINGANIQSGSSRTKTFSGLSPNTKYYIEIKCSGSGYEDSAWAGYYATTSSAEPWEWYYSKTSGQSFNTTRVEWIAFCNKINEARIANGLSVYSFNTSTTYIDKGKPFYAWIFLQSANAINQINGQVSTQILNIKSGDQIYAWYFSNLKTALNNAI